MKTLLLLALLLVAPTAQAQPVLLTAEHFKSTTPGQDGTRWRIEHDAQLSMPILHLPETPVKSQIFDVHTGSLAVALATLRSGRYEVHILMKGVSSSSDAVLIALDGWMPRAADGIRPQRTGSGISPRTYGRWAWARAYMGGARATLDVERDGRYAVTLIGREPGVRVASILLIPVDR